MKRNVQKIWAMASILFGMGSALVAFQNFVPNDRFQGPDTSDIYMNTALTDALQQQEKERRQHVKLHPQPEQPKPEVSQANPTLTK